MRQYTHIYTPSKTHNAPRIGLHFPFSSVPLTAVIIYIYTLYTLYYYISCMLVYRMYDLQWYNMYDFLRKIASRVVSTSLIWLDQHSTKLSIPGIPAISTSCVLWRNGSTWRQRQLTTFFSIHTWAWFGAWEQAHHFKSFPPQRGRVRICLVNRIPMNSFQRVILTKKGGVKICIEASSIWHLLLGRWTKRSQEFSKASKSA